MDSNDIVTVLGNLDRRVARIEQYLPSLATRDEMRVTIDEAISRAIAPLATRDEMHAAIDGAITRAVAPLATKAELREEGERTRRHFDVIAESLRDDIRLVAEGHIDLGRRMDARHRELTQADARLDVRVTRLESASRKKR